METKGQNHACLFGQIAINSHTHKLNRFKFLVQDFIVREKLRKTLKLYGLRDLKFKTVKPRDLCISPDFKI